MELLRDYVLQDSQKAFSALVARHVNMVYSAALRKTGNAQAAEEVTQVVFILLAGKAARLQAGTILSGWLYQAARLTAASFLRREFRRARREQEAAVQSLSSETESSLWPQIAPMLEDAMGKLSQKERDAVALRFFEGKSFQEIGLAVGASENAAKKRVGHGLEKLRAYFCKRGVVSTTAFIAGAISSNAVQSAPVALATPVVVAAVAKGAACGASTLALINGALGIMAWTKAGTALIAGAAVLLTAGTAILTTKAVRASQAASEVWALEGQQRSLTRQLQQLERERAEAATRLAAASEENARLRSSPAQRDLLKLRGQVGVLGQELAASRAWRLLSSGGTAARIAKDPALRSAMHQNLQQLIQAYFGDSFHELKLTPEQTEKAVQSIADWGTTNEDMLSGLAQRGTPPQEITRSMDASLGGLWKQLGPLLGEQGVARLQRVREELPAHVTVDLLNGRLSAGQLSDEQGARLLQIVKAEPFDLTSGILLTDPALIGAPAEIEDHLLSIAECNQRTVQQAGAFLSPEQLSALDLVLSNGVSRRLLSAYLFSGKR